MLSRHTIGISINRSILSMLIVGPIATIGATVGCTKSNSGPQGAAMTEAISPQADKNAPQMHEEIPVELKDATTFDPALTLDPKTVQESDFYQVKQSVEQNKTNLDLSWKEQERLEQSVKDAKKAEELRLKAESQKEEEERERQRQLAIQEQEKSEKQRAKDASDAENKVKRLPTINQEEVMWQGLEH